MTISTTGTRQSYIGNGVTTEFAFPYRFLANADLQVILVATDGTETVQVLNTDYTVAGAGSDSGGTVTMIVAPASGAQLVVYRELELTQEVDYITGDSFPAETHEQALDRLTMITQQIDEEVGRSLKFAVSVEDPDVTLPPLQAGKGLRVNDLGDGIAYFDIIDSGFIGVTQFRQTHTATEGQTVFTLTEGLEYSVGTNNILVSIDGRLQYSDAYTETDTNTITFSEGLSAGQVVEIVINDLVSQTSGATGSFTAGSGETITVVGGLITGIV